MKNIARILMVVMLSSFASLTFGQIIIREPQSPHVFVPNTGDPEADTIAVEEAIAYCVFIMNNHVPRDAGNERLFFCDMTETSLGYHVHPGRGRIVVPL